jgi:hypothetical protein
VIAAAPGLQLGRLIVGGSSGQRVGDDREELGSWKPPKQTI